MAFRHSALRVVLLSHYYKFLRSSISFCSSENSYTHKWQVRMVTGDNLNTARAIALECGILDSDADATEPNLIEGKTFRGLSEAQRLEVAEKISVRCNCLLD